MADAKSILLKMDENIKIQEKIVTYPLGGMSSGGVPPSVHKLRSYSRGEWTVNIDPDKRPEVVEMGGEKYYKFPENILSREGVLLNGKKVETTIEEINARIRSAQVQPSEPLFEITNDIPSILLKVDENIKIQEKSVTYPLGGMSVGSVPPPVRKLCSYSRGEWTVNIDPDKRPELVEKGGEKYYKFPENILSKEGVLLDGKKVNLREKIQKTPVQAKSTKTKKQEETQSAEEMTLEQTEEMQTSEESLTRRSEEMVLKPVIRTPGIASQNTSKSASLPFPNSEIREKMDKKEKDAITTSDGAVFREPSLDVEGENGWKAAPVSDEEEITFDSNKRTYSEMLKSVQEALVELKETKEALKAAETETQKVEGALRRANQERQERDRLAKESQKQQTQVYLPYHMRDGTIRYTPVSVSELEKWSTETSKPQTPGTQEPQMVTLTYKNIDGKDATISVPADKVADYGNKSGKTWKTAQQVLTEDKNDQVVTRSEIKLMRNTCGGCSYFTETIGKIKDAHWETQLQSVPVCGPLGRVRWYQQQYVNVQKPATPEVTYTPTSAPRRAR